MLDLRLAIDDSPVGETPIKVRCVNPTHKDRTASMAVYPGNIHCFAPQCGLHAHGIEALALLLKIDLPTAEQTQSKYTSEALDGYRERATEHAKSSPLPITHARLFNQQLNGRFHQRLSWLEQRGLTQETINGFLIGHNGEQFTIPIFGDDGNLISFRYRADPELCRPEYVAQHKYSGMSGRNGRYIYPADGIKHDVSDWIVLCEGEFDAMMLWQDGIPAATLTNGAGQMKHLPAMLPDRIENIYILADQDEAGRIAAHETTIAANELNLIPGRHVTVWELEDEYKMPDDCKDVTEAYLKGWRFNRAHG